MLSHVVSISGGKDSTALLLYALEHGVEPMTVCFADTGHEHQATYDYVEYLEQATGVEIRRVRNDFRAQIAKKRETVVTKWTSDGVPQERIDRALELLVPTGNPFLDLCLWKGRFPSTRARFCSEELKHVPINTKVIDPLLRSSEAVVSWQGIRAEESPARAKLPQWEITDPWPKLWLYRPIIRWTADQVFDMHRRHGIRWNPLYEQGMGRVGCMPCIHARKDELRQIAARFPEEVERVETWERLVSETCKRGSSTFFEVNPGSYDKINAEDHGIRHAVEWSKTSRGGKQYDLITSMTDQEPPQCSSIYGLCE